MGDLPLPASSGSVLLSEDSSSPRDTTASVEIGSGEDLALLDVLRQAVAVGTQPTDSILESLAEAAGVLSGANGIAIALRQNGVIVCRARSGDIAPELGSPLNTDSGISGECLRAAAILVCSDTATDQRVDSEVCERLGVKSIVAVPLRGRMGMVGILEAFSSRMGAFEAEQIEALRTLGEIAERAYERERRQFEPPATAKSRNPLVAAVTKSDPAAGGTGVIPLKRGYWLIGAVAAAVLLVSLVIGLSWRQTGAEIASSAPAAAAKSASTQASTQASGASPLRIAEAGPGPATSIRESNRETAGRLVHKAAEISPEADKVTPSSPSGNSSASNPSAAPSPPATSSSDESAPAMELAAANEPENFPALGSAPAALPTFGGNVSQGLTQAVLIRKVEPEYPAQALKQKITGSVTLEATVADTGNVRTVSVVSGPAQLALAAESAVRQWKYRPAVLDGKAVETQKEITIVFKLP
ncbi:MAG TPA: TonB family protein [Candidatus Sulfotelmatobacter sp.]